jgi:membrane protein implicated in regulation of membrane protease activity
MVWWLWVLLGIALLVIEMATPGGFFALFFGAGALLVAPLAALGFGPVWQWLAFPAVSLVLLASLRRSLLERIGQRPRIPVDEIVGQEVILLQDLPAGGEAKAELRGTSWAARSASAIPLRAGQRCRVERIEGLTLWVRAE